MELRQSACGVGKKLQTELAYDGIEATAPERKRLAIRGHRTKQRVLYNVPPRTRIVSAGGRQ
jgi:hypothetical protein